MSVSSLFSIGSIEIDCQKYLFDCELLIEMIDSAIANFRSIVLPNIYDPSNLDEINFLIFNQLKMYLSTLWKKIENRKCLKWPLKIIPCIEDANKKSFHQFLSFFLIIKKKNFFNFTFQMYQLDPIQKSSLMFKIEVFFLLWYAVYLPKVYTCTKKHIIAVKPQYS